MKKTEVMDLVCQGLAEVLAGTEFKLKKAAGAFTQKFPWGWQRIGIPLHDYNPKYIFSIVMTIRLDAVENVANLFNVADKKYHTETTTTITQLKYFCPDFGRGFEVTTEGEIAGALTKLAPIIKGKILPFFENLRSIKALDSAVNCLEKSIDSTHPEGCWRKSIILARLTGNSDFEKLAAKYRNEMEVKNYLPKAKEAFDKLAQYLREKDAAQLAGS